MLIRRDGRLPAGAVVATEHAYGDNIGYVPPVGAALGLGSRWRHAADILGISAVDMDAAI